MARRQHRTPSQQSNSDAELRGTLDAFRKALVSLLASSPEARPRLEEYLVPSPLDQDTIDSDALAESIRVLDELYRDAENQSI